MLKMGEATKLLALIRTGAAGATEELFSLVYEELRRLANRRLSKEAPGQTLQPTALVHEAYLRLIDANNSSEWDHRCHFFASAAKAMDRILVEKARAKNAKKRGGEHKRVFTEVNDIASAIPDDLVLTLHDAIKELEQIKPEAAHIVRLRFFVGMTNAQAADALEISPRTANTLWAYARAWLYEYVGDWQPQ